MLLDFHQRFFVFLYFLIASLHECVDGFMGETQGAITCNVWRDIDITYCLVIVSFRIYGIVNQAVKHFWQRENLAIVNGVPVANVYTDDDVGSHLLQKVSREVVDQTSVDEEMPTHTDRGEHTWNSHTSAHCQRNAAITNINFFSRFDIGGDTSKWYGQVVEIHVFLVAYAEVVKQID